MIARANGTVSDSQSELSVGELMAWFGVKGTVSQRAEPLLLANGVDPVAFSDDSMLGTADLLVSARRAYMVAQRDRWLKELLPDQVQRDPG